MVAAAVVGYLIGLLALRRTGIYFAMITVAIAEIFFFVEFNPLSEWTGGENGLPGVPTPSFDLGFTNAELHLRLVALSVPRVLLFRRHRDRAAHRALAGRRDPHARSARTRCARRRSATTCTAYKLTAFVIAAAYAGFAGGLLGVLQAFMPPDAFMFDTSGQLDHADRHRRARHAVRPARRRRPSGCSCRTSCRPRSKLGAAWKLVLGPGVRAAGVLPAPGNHRRHQGPVRAADAARRKPRAEPAQEAAPRGRGRGAGRADGGRAPRRRRRLPGADPAGHRPHQALRRRRRQRGHRLHRAAGRAARHHRPERRRQDDLLQDAHLRGAADRRARSSSRAATSPA